MTTNKKGFSLVEVLVALVIVAMVWASLSSILFSNYSRVVGGDGEDQLLELAHLKLSEMIEQGYPEELISPSTWEPFVSHDDENQVIYQNFRWRHSVEDYETPEWAEGSDDDKARRFKQDKIENPYRAVVIEVQEFEAREFFDENKVVGPPYKLMRIMKPHAPSQQEGQTAGAGG